MSSLTQSEILYLEKIFGMSDGSVLNLTNDTLGDLFRRHGVDIAAYGSSRVKKVRAFWSQEPDGLVGRVISEMLGAYETICDMNSAEVDEPTLNKAKAIVERLVGRSQEAKPMGPDRDFLDREFTIPDIRKLPVEQSVVPIIKDRLEEVKIALSAHLYLSVVILCGSILEAVLLGKAQQEPASFNMSKSSPKTSEGEVKLFRDWTLANFIDVATDVGVLKPDVQKFSHGLRGFRNYIHPHEQLDAGFTPDEYTAKLCFQAMKAALASVAGER
ncbi:MAG: hypothetical protein MPK06_02780 [Alphaproteobacteria bacterium]|nr:hypothetical protein [Alphaproteobacteria bacterium]MDA8003583.1 hypothetical protein [Alphaproteobacteria bacterium]MDA8005451.1 hypothetical protein [Alphaproteobacteria bacterium]MDA8012931.1 hypothetical protein [Alphaproteobacteria bacterium]